LNSKKIFNKGLVIVLVLTAVFYASFLFYGDLNSIGEIFFQINFWYIPLILLVRFLAVILRSLRQKLFLKSLGIDIPIKFNILVYISGLSMLVTPASSGVVIKSYILNKKFGTEYSKTIPIVITEKYHDVLAPLSIISVMLVFVDIFEIQFIAVVLSIIMLTIYVISRKQNLLQKIIHKTSKLKILNKFQENLLDYYDSFHTLSNKKPFILGWIIGIFSIFVDGLAIYFGFLALGADLGFLNSLVTVYTANILGMISFIPAGFGVTEVSLLGFLLKGGFVLSVASSMVIITRLSGVWFQIILGFSVTSYIFKKIP